MTRTNRTIVAVFLIGVAAFMGFAAAWPRSMRSYGALLTPRTWRLLETITFLLFSATVALGTSGWRRARKRSSEGHQK